MNKLNLMGFLLLTLSSYADSTHLEIGASMEAEIESNQYWNDTKIDMRRSESYELSVASDDKWTDAIIETNALGFPNSTLVEICKKTPIPFLCNIVLHPYGDFLMNSLRRVPRADFFTLIGNLNHNENLSFAIGLKKTVTLLTGGRFYAYANDWKNFYGNNTGSVNLRIKRIR